MIDITTPPIYEKVIQEKEAEQVRLVINTFRGVEYISLRKYYLNFEEEWLPSKEGMTMPLDLDNSRELFVGLVEILSLAESKSILEEEFKEILDEIYLT
jgi:TPP-dependent indolepyruvate ferredoxin oxidoreductase alpha subunit|tara:strand:- start:64 stop:360 length:297 start_codon:yes stop_codon:yes gene_type:complete